MVLGRQQDSLVSARSKSGVPPGPCGQFMPNKRSLGPSDPWFRNNMFAKAKARQSVPVPVSSVSSLQIVQYEKKVIHWLQMIGYD